VCRASGIHLLNVFLAAVANGMSITAFKGCSDLYYYMSIVMLITDLIGMTICSQLGPSIRVRPTLQKLVVLHALFALLALISSFELLMAGMGCPDRQGAYITGCVLTAITGLEFLYILFALPCSTQDQIRQIYNTQDDY
jgi:hypothetical protein